MLTLFLDFLFLVTDIWNDISAADVQDIGVPQGEV